MTEPTPFTDNELLVLLADPNNQFTGAIATLTDVPASTEAWQLLLDKFVAHASRTHNRENIDGIYPVTFWHEHGEDPTTGLLFTRFSNAIVPAVLTLPWFPEQTLGLLAITSDPEGRRSAVLALTATTSSTGEASYPADRVLFTSADGRTLRTLPISPAEKAAGQAIGDILLAHLNANIDHHRNNIN